MKDTGYKVSDYYEEGLVIKKYERNTWLERLRKESLI